MRIVFLLGSHYLYLDQYEPSLEYFKTYESILESLERPHIWGLYIIGYVYLVNGYREEAESYFNMGLEMLQKVIELERPISENQEFHNFYCLAAIQSILGDKDEAYKNLRLVNQNQRMPLWIITNSTNDPHFDNIREEPEFQQILRDVKAKYQVQHKEVRQWLEDNEML